MIGKAYIVDESSRLTTEDESFLDRCRVPDLSSEEEWHRILVARLQRILRETNPDLYEDGLFGPNTATALRRRLDVFLGPQLSVIVRKRAFE